MEHNHGDLEDDFPFQLGDFFGSMLIFQGVVFPPLSKLQKTPFLLIHRVTFKSRFISTNEWGTSGTTPSIP